MVPDVLHILTVPYILYHSLLDYDTIYLLTATGLIPGGVEQCTFTHKNNTQDNTITNWEECGPWAMSRLCELYPGICLTTEEKARKNKQTKQMRLTEQKCLHTREITEKLDNYLSIE